MTLPFYKRIKNRDYDPINIRTVIDEDDDPRKVDLCLAFYRTQMGLPWVMPSVKAVEKSMANDLSLHHESLSPLGLKAFRKAAMEFVLGKNNIRVQNGEVFTVQTVSGLNALRMICEILQKDLGIKTVYVSDPTWENPLPCFIAAGFSEVKTYRYFDRDRCRLDFDGMLEDIRKMPENSAIIFQGCCHDPTGCDPTKKQWIEIATVLGRVFPVIDMSNLGMASGDPEEDAYPVRLLSRLGFEFAIFMSFSQNFLLYNKCIGAAIFILKHKDLVIPLKSTMTTMVCGHYGSPPFHGAKIVSIILSCESLYKQWRNELNIMIKRIKEARNDFFNALAKHFPVGEIEKWEHIRNEVGSHSITYLTDRQVQHLIFYYHIYVKREGRISICGLNHNNIDYVAAAFANCIAEYPERYDVYNF